MRHEDVQAGQTYVLRVPQRLPASRYPADRYGALWRLGIQILGGTTLMLTVISTAAKASGELMIEGLYVTQRSHVTVELTREQLRDLGLPEDGPGYLVGGQLFDAEGHEVVLPTTHTLIVPARWLAPLEPGAPEPDEPPAPWL